VPKAKPRKSKSAHSDGDQLELINQSGRNLAVQSVAAGEEFGIPHRKLSHRLWNALVGVSLLPFVWIFTGAFFNTFSKAAAGATPVPFWMTHDFLMVGLGAAGWLAWLCISFAFWKQPRPIRAYVLGHEMMHMLMARLSGGHIKDCHISRDGGYIVTNRYNFLIALAPYLWPFYSVPVLAAWTFSALWKDVPYFREALLVLLGLTWMLHLTFTLWVLPRGQTDLLGPGRVFSLIIIYLANILLLGATIVMLAQEITWHDYGGHLWASTKDFYEWAGAIFDRLVSFFGEWLRGSAGA